MSRHGPIGQQWFTCACGKRAYTKKRAAKHQRRVIDPTQTMSIYRCDLSGLWHVGHLPSAVRQGRLDRDYPRKEPA